jgi:hypothetical protein
MKVPMGDFMRRMAVVFIVLLIKQFSYNTRPCRRMVRWSTALNTFFMRPYPWYNTHGWV